MARLSAAAEAAVLRASAEAGLADAARYPMISLGAMVLGSRNINNNRNKPAQEFDIVTAGPTVEVPLFDWGYKQAQAASGHHLLAASLQDFRAAVLIAYQEAENALGQLQLASKREAAAVRQLADTGEITKAMRRRETLGLASSLDNLTVEAAELAEEKELVEAKKQKLLAYVAVFKVLAGASPPSTENAVVAR